MDSARPNSWEDIRNKVRNFRSQQPFVPPPVRDICFDRSRRKIIFLGVDPTATARIATLFSADIPTVSEAWYQQAAEKWLQEGGETPKMPTPASAGDSATVATASATNDGHSGKRVDPSPVATGSRSRSTSGSSTGSRSRSSSQCSGSLSSNSVSNGGASDQSSISDKIGGSFGNLRQTVQQTAFPFQLLWKSSAPRKNDPGTKSAAPTSECQSAAEQANSVINFQSPPEQDTKIRIKWDNLLAASWTSAKLDRLSREELLLRERMRVGSQGITSYIMDEETGIIIYPYASSLYMQSLENPKMMPREIRSLHSGARMDAKIGGEFKNLIAFVRDNDIWVVDISSEIQQGLLKSGCIRLDDLDNELQNFEEVREKRLTFSKQRPYHSSGVAEFVMQEEFHRFTGYWWAPVPEYALGADDKLERIERILYVEIDESEVTRISIPRAGHEGQVDEYRFPRVGTKNVVSEICLVEFRANDAQQFVESIPIKKSLIGKFSLRQRFQFEYIPRLGWMPDGKSIWVQLLDRSQQSTKLVRIPVEEFMTVEEYNQHTETNSEVPVTTDILMEEHSKYWINVTNVYHFFEPKLNEFKFIWASERTGFRHLYLHRHPTGLGVKLEPSVHLITSGEYQVVDHKIWVDEKRHLVYFVARKDTPLENHLYVAAVDATSSAVVRLTPRGFSHTVTMSIESDEFVATYSSVSRPPRSAIFKLVWPSESSRMKSDHQQQRQQYHYHGDSSIVVIQFPVPVLVAQIEPNVTEPLKIPTPEFFSFENSNGDTIYGYLYLPENYDPSKRYPTLLKAYCGPHAQLVVNEYQHPKQIQLHMAVKFGFAVVAIDGRGSYNRGLAFEGHLKHSMGTIELVDQVEGLNHIIRTRGVIDPEKIVIYGWSYGGYISLMGLIQYPDMFAMAISGAPVTSWDLYDTGYTERYMGTPTDNPAGYKRGSILNLVSQLPDDENRLLITHGLIDENVHFKNTELLVDALVKAGKPFQLQIYPNERHGIRTPSTNEYFDTFIFHWMINSLNNYSSKFSRTKKQPTTDTTH